MRCRGWIAVLALLVSATTLQAQGRIEIGRTPWAGGVVRTRTDVRAQVNGRVASVTVEEWFQNRGGGLAEGDYIYPVPGEAVFASFSLYQGDQELRGETLDAEHARAIYEEIVRKKRDPALIELVGHGMLRARVFPINPGETRKITLRYTQMLGATGDAYEFRYAAPSADARPVPITRVEDDRATMPQSASPIAFHMTIENADNFNSPYSPTHDVRATREGNRWNVQPASQFAGNFTLLLPLSRRTVGISVVTHKPSSEPGYFMMTLSPGSATVERAIARDLTIVVDVSGSMAGSKIEQAKEALGRMLSSLTSADRFRIIAFNGNVSSYRNDWTEASPERVRNAREWIRSLAAEGGTNIAEALREAFRAHSPDGRLELVLFMTDGLPSSGEQNPERIAADAERLRGDARVFAFGVGYDVNTYLLDRLTAAGRGTTQYVTADQDVERAISLLSTKIQHPVLASLSIAGTPVRVTEMYPAHLPDLFANEELVVFGRYTTDSDVRGNLAISGTRSARTQRFETAVQFREHELSNDFIPRLWAARKVGSLEQQLKLNGPNAEIEQELRDVALRYGVLSQYTAYLVQEPTLPMAKAPGAGPAISEANFSGAGAAPPTVRREADKFVGKAAVAAASEASMRREVRNSAALERAQDAASNKPGSAQRKRISTRIFELRDGALVEITSKSSPRTVRIEPFSVAYFRILEALPEMRVFWKSSDRIEVAGKLVSIGLGKGGRAEMTPAEIRQLVKAFRGS